MLTSLKSDFCLSMEAAEAETMSENKQGQPNTGTEQEPVCRTFI